MRGSGHKIGAFVGYSFIDQALNRFNCVQIANKEGGSCTAPDETPTPPNVVRFQEIDKWHAMRVGVIIQMEHRFSEQWCTRRTGEARPQSYAQRLCTLCI
jgi:hypothetical protein